METFFILFLLQLKPIFTFDLDVKMEEDSVKEEDNAVKDEETSIKEEQNVLAAPFWEEEEDDKKPSPKKEAGTVKKEVGNGTKTAGKKQSQPKVNHPPTPFSLPTFFWRSARDLVSLLFRSSC